MYSNSWLCNISNKSGRVESDIQTRAEGSKDFDSFKKLLKKKCFNN
jgi:hypothetical protein